MAVSPAGSNTAGHLEEPLQDPASPSNTAGQLEEPLQDPASPSSPAESKDNLQEPPLQPTLSPVPKAIPFMGTSKCSPLARPHEMSLDAWGQEEVEGWGNDEDDWMNQ